MGVYLGRAHLILVTFEWAWKIALSHPLLPPSANVNNSSWWSTTIKQAWPCTKETPLHLNQRDDHAAIVEM
jgi:hypothetical protein